MEPFITSSLNVSQKIPNRQVSGLTTGVVVFSQVGPLTPTRVTSPRQFLDLYTTNKTLNKGDHPSLHNAYFLSRSVDLVVTRATNTKVYPLVGLGGAVDSVLLPNGRYADTVEVITPTAPGGAVDFMEFGIQLDNVVFIGKYPEVTELPEVEEGFELVRLSGALATDSDTLNTAIFQEIANAFKGGGEVERGNIHVQVEGGSFKVYSSSEFPIDNTNFVSDVITNISMSDGVVTLGATDEPFLVGYRNVGSVNTLKVWVTDVVDEGEFQYWNLNISDNLNGLATYKVSDNPEATDVQGNPIFYTWIEDIRPDVIYKKNTASTKKVAETAEPTSPNVGESTDFKLSTSTTASLIASAKYAAASFADYEGTRIQLYTDAGWYNQAVGKELESVAGKRKGLACVGIEPSIKDVNVIKQYASSYNGYYSIVHTNGGKDTSIVGFQIPISPSCYYITAVARNTTRNANYAPTFSKVNGTITEGNLYHTYTKSQRDELNKARVNVLIYDNTDGVAYINNNLLTDSSGSLIDEDQSIRIVNEIQYDIEKLMENFYSRFNVEGTRSAVVTAIDNYFRTNILSQSYTIGGYNIECSSVNNNDVTIQNNELKVEVFIKLNHSIKYINVVTNVVPTL